MSELTRRGPKSADADSLKITSSQLAEILNRFYSKHSPGQQYVAILLLVRFSEIFGRALGHSEGHGLGI